MSKKLTQIPSISTLSSIQDPNLKRFLLAIKAQVEGMQRDVNRVGTSIKRPSVQDMIDAGVVNADKIK
jgi:hypothetical protein